MRIRLFLLAILSCCAALPAFGLDAAINFYGSDRSFYRFNNDPSAPRFQYDITLSGDAASNLNLAFTLWSAHKILLTSSAVTSPEELDYTATASYNTESFSAGLTGTLFTPYANPWEIGLYFDYYVPTPMDMLKLMIEAAVYSDLSGAYAELKLAPGVSLPLSPILDFNVPITAGFISGGFGGSTGPGVTGVQFAPKLTVLVSDDWNFTLSGGYFLALRSENVSYPFFQAKVSFQFSTPEAAPAQ